MLENACINENQHEVMKGQIRMSKKRWDHKYVYACDDMQKIQKTLDEYSLKGWELVTAIRRNFASFGLFFKRPAADQDS